MALLKWINGIHRWVLGIPAARSVPGTPPISVTKATCPQQESARRAVRCAVRRARRVALGHANYFPTARRAGPFAVITQYAMVDRRNSSITP